MNPFGWTTITTRAGAKVIGRHYQLRSCSRSSIDVFYGMALQRPRQQRKLMSYMRLGNELQVIDLHQPQPKGYAHHNASRKQQRRSVAAWWRNVGSSHIPNTTTTIMTDVSKKRVYPTTLLNDEYTISICAVQGYRPYMEDEFMIHSPTTGTSSSGLNPDHNNNTNNNNGGIVGIFDGHGGKLVSRYLRQNVYMNLLAALQMIQYTTECSLTTKEQQNDVAATTTTAAAAIISDDVDNDDETSSNDEGLLMKGSAVAVDGSSNHDSNKNLDENNIHNLVIDDSYLISGLPSTTRILYDDNATATTTANTSFTSPSMGVNATTSTTSASSAPIPRFTVDDYVTALEIAIDKVDREVLKVRHWKRQGSTAIICWIHVATIENANIPPSMDSNDNVGNSTADHQTYVRTSTTTSMPASDDTSTVSTKPQEAYRQHQQQQRTLITANIGDSRAILCRDGVAIALSRDHKPNDPIEQKRIHRLGGTIVWDGEVDRMRQPIPYMGCYRVNNNLAISRAIGDRDARPVITSDPDITTITLLHPNDEFIVLASDGLWDNMSSSDVVAFIRTLVNSIDGDSIDRDSIATYVVEEALRRGSDDNITVVVVWLK